MNKSFRIWISQEKLKSGVLFSGPRAGNALASLEYIYALDGCAIDRYASGHGCISSSKLVNQPRLRAARWGAGFELRAHMVSVHIYLST